jgi:hypothetical protein
MASTYSDLKIELIGTGEQTGTWGTTTNNNFSVAVGEAITGSADVAFSSADVTVTLTNTNASQAARNLRLNLTGTSGGARQLILGSGCQIEKLYLINNGLADAVTVKNTTGTGIVVPAGTSMFVFNNGTNVVAAVTAVTDLTDSSLTAGRVTYAGTGGNLIDSANLTFNGTTLTAAALTSTGVATFSAGTVSAPAITTTGDTNTGIYFPAADTIGFTEGGVEALRLNANGQTSTSIAGTASLPSFTRTGDENTGIFFPAADTIAFTEGGVESMRIDSSGNVGIGTTTMTGRLNVGGSANPNIYSLSTGGISTVMASVDTFAAGILGTVSNHPQVFYTNNTERMRINAVGDVGIGTPSPSTKLTVLTATNGGILVTDGTYNGIMYASGLGGIVAGTTSAHPYILFANNAERMRITSAGNVGIGTSSPTDVLDVRGGIRSTDGTTSSRLISFSNACFFGTLTDAPIVFQVNNTERMKLDTNGNVGIGTSSPQGRMTLQGAAGTNGISQGLGLLYSTGTAFGALGLNNSSGWPQLMARANAGITFHTNSDLLTTNERMRIDSAGNVCINTTGAGQIFNIQGGIQLYGDANTRGIYWNMYGVNSNYIDVNGAVDGNIMRFGTTNTERMRIDSSGNVLIGSTTTSYKLSVLNPSGADRNLIQVGISGITNGFTATFINSSNSMAYRFTSLTTTVNAANAYLEGSDGERLYRSTSSMRYKKDIESIEQPYSDAVLNLRPVWYRSKAEKDKTDWSWYGLIAEEVAEIEPRLVHWSYLDSDYDVIEENGSIKKTPKADAKLVPDGVQYDRVAVLLLDVVKRQEQAIQEQQTLIENLTTRLNALEGK